MAWGRGAVVGAAVVVFWPMQVLNGALGDTITVMDAGAVNWRVVENSLDFLRNAVEETASGDDERLKYAVLHLFAGIETLVKSRLAREHWALIADKIERAKRTDFTAGEMRTVGAGQALSRLRDIVGLTVTGEDVAAVEAVEKLRNRTAHFALVGETPEGIRSAIGRGLHFALSFLSTNVAPGAPAKEASSLLVFQEDVAPALGEIDELVATRMAGLEDKLSGNEPAVVCPRCLQPALLLEEGLSARCLYCLYEPDGSEGALEYVGDVLDLSKYRTVKQGGDWPIYDCLQCSAEALVAGIEAPRQVSIYWGCFACGYAGTSAAIVRCGGCGGLMEANEDGFELCSDCVSYKMSRD